MWQTVFALAASFFVLTKPPLAAGQGRETKLGLTVNPGSDPLNEGSGGPGQRTPKRNLKLRKNEDRRDGVRQSGYPGRKNVSTLVAQN